MESFSRTERESETGSSLSLKQDRAVATREALISAARGLFCRAGYHGAGVHDIVEKAKVTRGALYYHFREKKDLFEAVYRRLIDETYQAVVEEVDPISDDPWEHYLESLRISLRMTTSGADVQRILLIEGPAVLGWEHWRHIRTQMSMEGSVGRLRELMDSGVIERRNPEILAHLILAAVDDASMTIIHSPEPEATLHDASDALLALVRGLRVDKGPKRRSSSRPAI